MDQIASIPSGEESLFGRRFGLLKVLDYAGLDGPRASAWRCTCKCGKEVLASSRRLLGKDYVEPMRSCGCTRFVSREQLVRTASDPQEEVVISEDQWREIESVMTKRRRDKALGDRFRAALNEALANYVAEKRAEALYQAAASDVNAELAGIAECARAGLPLPQMSHETQRVLARVLPRRHRESLPKDPQRLLEEIETVHYERPVGQPAASSEVRFALRVRRAYRIETGEKGAYRSDIKRCFDGKVVTVLQVLLTGVDRIIAVPCEVHVYAALEAAAETKAGRIRPERKKSSKVAKGATTGGRSRPQTSVVRHK